MATPDAKEGKRQTEPRTVSRNARVIAFLLNSDDGEEAFFPYVQRQAASRRARRPCSSEPAQSSDGRRTANHLHPEMSVGTTGDELFPCTPEKSQRRTAGTITGPRVASTGF